MLGWCERCTGPRMALDPWACLIISLRSLMIVGMKSSRGEERKGCGGRDDRVRESGKFLGVI